MANAKIKTTQNDASVSKFLNSIENEQRKADGVKLVEIMSEVTGQEPKMWGPAIVGFGNFHYKYESGREGDMPRVAFSPRKQNLTLYVLGNDPKLDELLEKLGTKHSTSKACLYINKLSDVDESILREIISGCYKTPSKYEV